MVNGNNQRTRVQDGDIVVYSKNGGWVKILRPSHFSVSSSKLFFENANSNRAVGDMLKITTSIEDYLTTICQITGLQAVEIKDQFSESLKWQLIEGNNIFNNENISLLPKTLKENEKELIENTIARNKGDMTQSACQLGIVVKTLSNKRKKYGIPKGKYF